MQRLKRWSGNLLFLLQSWFFLLQVGVVASLCLVVAGAIATPLLNAVPVPDPWRQVIQGIFLETGPGEIAVVMALIFSARCLAQAWRRRRRRKALSHGWRGE